MTRVTERELLAAKFKLAGLMVLGVVSTIVLAITGVPA